MLGGLGLGERASLVLLEGALVELDHATLVLVDSLVMTLRCCCQMIALRVISNDRRRAALHIIMMILITSHISVQGFPAALARMTVARHLPLDEIRIHHADWDLLLLLILVIP